MPLIRKLPPSVVNKIAAGEVIERPASVVKELMENALDAGARRVDVLLEDGGMELIRVADDGCGIAADQLPLAVAPHATSKIADADDLFRVRTLGFRGEALASIAEVSRFSIRSRTAETEGGAQLDVTGGKAEEPVPCGCPIGTVVEVRNLFFNTPVRRKFLRTRQTEMGHAAEAFTRIALAHPQVHFTLAHGERTLFDLPASDSLRERVAAFFGEPLAESLLWIESEDAAVRLSGYVADPSQSRANNRMQYLFLNGRFIRDRALQHALAEAYRGLLMTGRMPICFLRLAMPADLVDVNVHPTKMEVRFQDSGRLYSQLLGALRTRFLSTDLTARYSADRGGEPDAAARALDEQQSERMRRELVEWAKSQLPEEEALAPAQRRQEEFDLQFERPPGSRLELVRIDRPAAAAASPAPPPARDPAEGPPSFPASPASPASHPSPPAAAPGATPRPLAMQVHNRYLVTETEEGMVVIDQHALHERILYEQLRRRVLSGAVERQRLLMPEPVPLAPAEAAAVLDAREALARLGLEVEPFGGDTVILLSYPAILGNIQPEQMLRDVIDHLLSGGRRPDRRDLLDGLLHMVACKAAVKAGDRLAPEEIAALLEARHLVDDAHHCPHGRPTALVFTREELDRRFKRI